MPHLNICFLLGIHISHNLVLYFGVINVLCRIMRHLDILYGGVKLLVRV